MILFKKEKNYFIEEDEDYRVINIDETGIFLEIGFNITNRFQIINILIYTNCRDHYRLSVMLSATGDGTKLEPLIILKVEPGKTVETKLKNLS